MRGGKVEHIASIVEIAINLIIYVAILFFIPIFTRYHYVRPSTLQCRVCLHF